MEPSKASARRAFTLLELLVAIAVLTIISAILFQMLGQTSDLWRRNRSRIEAFQSARNAFERVTRQLSQATLDTYLDYFDGAESRTDVARSQGIVPVNFNSSRYDWASDLQFVIGDANTIVHGARGETPTHAVFFVAPTGRVGTSAVEYRRLDKLLNALGYYIEYLGDGAEIPPFLRGQVQERFRYRLVELNQSSDGLRIYDGGGFAGARSWYNEAIEPPDGTDPSTFVLADNVIALILRPRVSGADSGSVLGSAIESSYAFDSKGYLHGGNLDLKNQLPPLVQVTMVTIDEASAERYAQRHGDDASGLVPSGAFTNPARFDADLESLEERLAELGLDYRVFTTDVSLRGAKSNLN